MRGEERVVVVRRAGESGAIREIALTQDDVRQVQLAKGAIASGAAVLQRVAGIATEEVEELMLAGGFGNYVSIESALRIGLIPALPASRVRYVGNAAALGAQMCLLSEAERATAARIATADRARVAGDPSRLRGDLRGLHELPRAAHECAEHGLRPRPLTRASSGSRSSRAGRRSTRDG